MFKLISASQSKTPHLCRTIGFKFCLMLSSNIKIRKIFIFQAPRESKRYWLVSTFQLMSLRKHTLDLFSHGRFQLKLFELLQEWKDVNSVFFIRILTVRNFKKCFKYWFFSFFESTFLSNWTGLVFSVKVPKKASNFWRTKLLRNH